MISVENLTKDYGSVTALDSVSLTAKPGEEIMVMGPSGSGKTTLVNLIAGLDRPTRGRIRVGDIVVTDLNNDALSRYRREHVGIVFQQFHLIDYLTALENVMLAQYFHSMPEEADALQSLEMVGLKDRADHLPSELSGGEQQRVAIARAITNDPELILADEPTGNLDEENERIVMEIFHTLKEAGKTVITVTHNRALTARCDQLIRLKHGRLVSDNPNRIDRVAAGL